jgi:hypothetical protein
MALIEKTNAEPADPLVVSVCDGYTLSLATHAVEPLNETHLILAHRWAF